MSQASRIRPSSTRILCFARPTMFPWLGVVFLSSVLSIPILAANPDTKSEAAPAKESEKAKKTESSKKESVELQWGEIEITGVLPEAPTVPGLFGEMQESLLDVIKRLDHAAGDKKLHGIVLKIKSVQIGWGKLHEVRSAIARVRAAGKKTIAWLEEGGSMDYLLATACDEVVIPEPAALMLVGLRAEVSFYKNLFEKLDLKPDMLRVGEYKSAAEPYTRSEMSPQFREEMEAILDDYYGQMVEVISSSRKITPDEVRSAIDSGPLTSKAALNSKLVDRLEYIDQVESRLKGESPDEKVKWLR
ncbi:MAG: S49 family peptidase, partial [Planctomycetaceae bacterium]|nr:S49 family peptidase [Planctomycetaceae bacterium]